MGRLSQLLYADVSIRTSAFPAAMGLAVALTLGYGVLDISTVIAVAVSLIGIIVVQGFEHALDVLHDKGGYSAFRSGRLEPLARSYVRRFPLLLAPLLIILILVWRPWLIFFGLVAALMSKLYVRSHNEWYAVAGFMSAFAVGYFSATNWPSLPFLAGFVITGFLYKASLSMYRIDDYLEGELPGNLAVIQYYRNIFRYTLHYVPPLVVVLLLSATNPLPLHLLEPYSYAVWVAGFAAMGIPMARYRAERVYQEAPIWTVIAAIAAVDLAAAALAGPEKLALYAVLYSVLALVVNSFWRSRHAMCNIIGCPVNPLLNVERPR